MDKAAWAREALTVFDQVVQAGSGLRPRAGQRLMAEQVACTFAEADLGKPPEDEDGPIEALEPARSIAVIQAGTGVGKSLAYSVPAIVLALARNTRVMISTATVALQEQLVHKDLPALAKSLPQPFRFALAKGRGRYVCKLKLDRWASGADDDEWAVDDDLFAEEAAAARRWSGGGAARSLSAEQELAERTTWYAGLAHDLEKGRWDGDRDTLAQPPEAAWWAAVAAESSSCTARHCPAYNQCSYYEQRKALVGAQVIVVNHDLLLSSLGSRLLPELDNCLLVLDEAHHLPATALEQFASSMDLSRLKWIDRLTTQAMRTGGLLAVEEVADIPKCSALVRQHLQDVARLLMHHYGSALRGEDAPARQRGGWGQGSGGVSGRVRARAVNCLPISLNRWPSWRTSHRCSWTRCGPSARHCAPKYATSPTRPVACRSFTRSWAPWRPGWRPCTPPPNCCYRTRQMAVPPWPSGSRWTRWANSLCCRRTPAPPCPAPRCATTCGRRRAARCSPLPRSPVAGISTFS